MKSQKLALFLFIIGGFIYFGITNGVLAKEKAFPSKPIELICPYGAGGSTSMGGRIVAGTLSEFIGTPVVLINKPGGAGTLGPTYVAKSKPDGYTLLIFGSGPIVVGAAFRQVSYKIEDFEILGQYAIQPLVLAVRSDAPWKTVGELVGHAKNAPGTLKYSMDGVGSTAYLVAELFKSAGGGLKIDAIPFQSGTEMIAALLGGHVQMTCSYIVDLKGAYEAGRVRILATGTDKRLEEYPDIPTFAELGYAVDFPAWNGIAAPAGVAKEVSDKLKNALYKTVQSPDVKNLLNNIGWKPVFRNAEEFTRYAKEQRDKVLGIKKEVGIKVD